MTTSDPRPDRTAEPLAGREPLGSEPGLGSDRGTARPPERTSTREDLALEEAGKGGSRTAAIWIALILGAIVLILLLIFIIQNNARASFEYFGATFSLPLGVAMLLAAIAGALVMALVGSVRMIQMALDLRKLRKQVDEVRRATRGR